MWRTLPLSACSCGLESATVAAVPTPTIAVACAARQMDKLFRVAGSVDGPGDGGRRLERRHVGGRQARAGGLVPDGDPEVVQVVLAAKDLQVLACRRGQAGVAKSVIDGKPGDPEIVQVVRAAKTLQILACRKVS